MSEPIDIVISFDTTGSMYPCLAEVRRKVDETTKRLFNQIPNLRVGIIAHGDYCDAGRTYVTKHLTLTNDPNAVSYFVKNVEATGGGDAPECYELVLREATVIKWTKGSKRLLVMIGDDIPHPTAHNPQRIDWKAEVNRLTEMGVLVHGVQCLNRYYASSFYSELAARSGGAHLNLNQFNEATEMLLAVAYNQQSPEAFQRYEEEIITAKRMTRTMSDIFAKLAKRESNGRYRKIDARAVKPGRFQLIDVEENTPIKELVQDNGLVFKTGRGFYEFTKKETIQPYKQVLILNKESGDLYEGDAAREVLGLTAGANVRIKPDFDTDKYKVFVQSTSSNRKLIGGTTFLYEAVEE